MTTAEQSSTSQRKARGASNASGYGASYATNASSNTRWGSVPPQAQYRASTQLSNRPTYGSSAQSIAQATARPNAQASARSNVQASARSGAQTGYQANAGGYYGYGADMDASAFYSTTATASAYAYAPSYAPQPMPQPTRAPQQKPQQKPMQRTQARKAKKPFMTVALYFQVCLLLFITLAGGGMLVAQYERISSLNNQANGFAKEISIYQDQAISLEVKLACTLDLNALNTKALETGMNYPLDEQIVELP